MFKQGPDFSLRDKRLFEITEVEITRVACIYMGVDVAISQFIFTQTFVINDYCQELILAD